MSLTIVFFYSGLIYGLLCVSKTCRLKKSDLEGASPIWGTGVGPMVPNQNYRENGKESPSTKC